jgi:hypothetical protein
MNWRISLLVVFSSLSLPAFAQSLHLHYDFSRYWQGSDSTWTGDWSHVPGQPVIPVVYARILVPQGTEVGNGRFQPTGVSSLRALSFPAEPFPKPLCGGVPESDTREKTFTWSQRFPARSWGEMSLQRTYGYRTLYVPLYAVEYYPHQHRGRTYQGMDIDIELHGTYATEPLFRGDAEDRAEVRNIVDNPEILRSYHTAAYGETKPSAVKVEYVAIGPASLLNLKGDYSLSSLLLEKRARGITAGKMSIEQIQKDYAGRDTP